MVLVLAGHDPTGGAGLVADAESVAACGGWALTVPTALTVQDLVDVQAVHPVPASTIRQAAAALETNMGILNALPNTFVAKS